jgi:hypothetical protein
MRLSATLDAAARARPCEYSALSLDGRIKTALGQRLEDVHLRRGDV